MNCNYSFIREIHCELTGQTEEIATRLPYCMVSRRVLKLWYKHTWWVLIPKLQRIHFWSLLFLLKRHVIVTVLWLPWENNQQSVLLTGETWMLHFSPSAHSHTRLQVCAVTRDNHVGTQVLLQLLRHQGEERSRIRWAESDASSLSFIV